MIHHVAKVALALQAAARSFLLFGLKSHSSYLSPLISLDESINRKGIHRILIDGFPFVNYTLGSVLTPRESMYLLCTRCFLCGFFSCTLFGIGFCSSCCFGFSLSFCFCSTLFLQRFSLSLVYFTLSF